MKHAAKVTLGYLALTLPLVLRSAFADAPGSATGTVVLVHLAAMVSLAWTVQRRDRVASGTDAANDAPPWAERAARFVGDWLPLLLVAVLYGELPYLIAGLHGAPVRYHDAAVQRWELAVFGAQPAHELAGSLPFAWLSELVHGGYVSYYALIFAPPLLLYARGRREAFATTSLALMATFVVCYLAFIVFPVQGPRYAWPSPPGIPSGPIRSAVLWILGNGSSRGTAFPSSHAAVSVAATIAALRFQRREGVVVGMLTMLLIVGAVYGGFHYAVDMAAGALVGAAVATSVVIGRKEG